LEEAIRMIMRMAQGAILACVLSLSALFAAPANAAGPLEKNFWLSGPRYDGILPGCENPAVLQQISLTFAEKETKFWNSDLRILDFPRVREIAFRPWAVNAIPRRFCSGQVVVSDGRKRHVNYSIIEDGGEIGATWGVEWCVVGLDRNWAYNPGCRMARP
jgi:hypothetical protein